MSRTWLRFCRITALLLVLALGSAVCTHSADAGVLERVKAAMDYRHNLVEGALGFVKEGVLEETDPADFNRRTSAFYGRQEVEGINTFAEIVADGRAKLSTGWEGLKGRLADTLLGKAASAVKDKLWDAVSSGQRRTETGRTERSTSRARPAREARKPWEDDTSGDGDAESARTLAEIAADGEVPDFIEPDTSEEADTDSAGGIDPLIALDIDEDEQDWYRSETGILDEGPLPEVRFAAVADGAGRRGPDETSVYPPGDSEGDCEDVWDDCPGDTDWTEQRHEDVGQSDEWVGYDEPQDPGDGYQGGDDWQYEAGNWLDQSGDGQASGLEDDTWRPWADGAVAHGEEGAESDGHSQWGRASNDCDDVWADCPVDTDWGEEQQDATGRFDQWAGYDQPRDDAAAQWQGDDWRYGSEGALDLAPGDEGGAHSAREDYEKALGGVLNEDGSSFADPSPVSERDYQSALQEMEWQVAEQARIEAEKAEARAAEERRRREEARREQEAREKARIEAEKAKAREAEERRRREAERRKKEEEGAALSRWYRVKLRRCGTGRGRLWESFTASLRQVRPTWRADAGANKPHYTGKHDRWSSLGCP